jgi:hypothetical protein
MEGHAKAVAKARVASGDELRKQVAVQVQAGELHGTYEVMNATKVRVGKEIESAFATNAVFEKGDLITIDEAIVLDDGRIRVRCEAGWISYLTSQGTQILQKVAPKVTRQSSLDAISTDLEATGIGSMDHMVQQMMFKVTQKERFLKNVPKDIQLKIGSQNVQFFFDNKPLCSILYNNLSKWASSAGGLLEFGVKKNNMTKDLPSMIKLQSDDAKKISALMTQNTQLIREEIIRVRAIENTEPEGVWQCLRDSQARAGMDKTSTPVVRVLKGYAVEVVDAQRNEKKQWRIRIGRVWDSSSCTYELREFIPANTEAWVSIKNENGSNLFQRVGDVPSASTEAVTTGGTEEEDSDTTSLEIETTLDLNYSQTCGSAAQRQEFASSFKQEVSNALSVKETQVDILFLRGGSVVVGWQILQVPAEDLERHQSLLLLDSDGEKTDVYEGEILKHSTASQIISDLPVGLQKDWYQKSIKLAHASALEIDARTAESDGASSTNGDASESEPLRRQQSVDRELEVLRTQSTELKRSKEQMEEDLRTRAQEFEMQRQAHLRELSRSETQVSRMRIICGKL